MVFTGVCLYWEPFWTIKSVQNEIFSAVFSLITVQFDGVEKSRMSPTKEGKTRPLQRHSSGCLVNTKMTSLDHCSSSLGERIDPTMPLESQLWVKSWFFFSSFDSFLLNIPLLFLLSHPRFLSFAVAGTMEPSAEQMQSLCLGSVRRPAILWETARPARTTTPSLSSKNSALVS